MCARTTVQTFILLCNDETNRAVCHIMNTTFLMAWTDIDSIIADAQSELSDITEEIQSAVDNVSITYWKFRQVYKFCFHQLLVCCQIYIIQSYTVLPVHGNCKLLTALLAGYLH